MNPAKSYPAMTMGVVVAVLNLIVGLGYLDQSTAGMIADVALSAVTLAAAYLVHRRVTPVVKAKK